MPSAHELIAHGRSTEEVCELIGADWLVYQELPTWRKPVRAARSRSTISTARYSTANTSPVMSCEAYLNRIEAGAQRCAVKTQGQAIIAYSAMFGV
jgi:amidophosphoribosyltransferase